MRAAFVGTLQMCCAILRKHLIAPKMVSKKRPFSRITQEKGAVKLYSAQEKLRSAVLSEVLNGTNHLRGVGVLVVVPRHDLNLIGVVAATLNFCTFPSSSSQFRNNSYSTRHTVVVPNRFVRTKIISRFSVICKDLIRFASDLHFSDSNVYFYSILRFKRLGLGFRRGSSSPRHSPQKLYDS